MYNPNYNYRDDAELNEDNTARKPWGKQPATIGERFKQYNDGWVKPPQNIGDLFGMYPAEDY